MTSRPARNTVMQVSSMLAALCLALVVVASGDATATHSSKAADTSITAILGSVIPDVAQGQNYIPITEGWDAQDGVKVTNQAANGALAAISALQAGQGDVSPSLADNIPLAVQKGGGVISVLQMAYSPSFSIVYPAGGDVQSVTQLKGATIGIQNLTSASYTLARGIVSAENLNPDKDVKYVSIGQTTQAAQAVGAGKVDVAIFTTAQLAFLDKAGVKYKYQRIPGLSRNYVGQQIAVSTKTLSDPTKKAALVVYLRNYLRAWKLERYNEPEFIQLYLKSTQDTTDMGTIKSDLAYNDFDRILPPEAYGRMGYSSAKYWNSLMKYEVDAGILTSAPPASKVFTTSLLQEVNQGTCGPYDSIRIAYDGSLGVQAAELWVGLQQGFFGQESVKVTLVKAASSAAALGAVSSGKADLALVGGSSLPAAKAKKMSSVYQSTYGAKSTVVAAPNASLANTDKKGVIIRTLQGFNYAHQLCVAQATACASSYKAGSHVAGSPTALASEIKSRTVKAGKHPGGWNVLAGATNNTLLDTVNNQQCYWTKNRPN